MKIKFVVEIDKDRVYKLDLQEDLKIHEENIDVDLRDQPERYLQYSTIAEMAKAKAERLEYEVERYENDLDVKLREEAESHTEKITEGRLRALIKSDAKRTALIKEWLEAKEQAGKTFAARDAFAQRKDCLISMGAIYRARWDMEPHVKEKK